MTATSASRTIARDAGGSGMRWLFAGAAAGAVTFALFAVMQVLVAVDILRIEEPAAGEPIVIHFVIPDFEPRPPIELPDAGPIDPPPAAPAITTSSQVPSQNPVYLPTPPQLVGTEAAGPVEVILPPPPLDVRVAPAYPRRELARGVEGRCTVRYDILASGATANIQVLECDSSGFAQASVAAVARWRHAAHRGRAPDEVVVRGHATTLDFTLEQ
ncbi:MAG: TonB family protein [Oceanicaulis sp.]